MSKPKIYVLHENTPWTEPLASALEALGAPFELLYLDEGTLDLGARPPEGVFYSRMSASSHSRGHRYAAEYTGCVLRWLEAHGKEVLNGSRALALEVSKAAQYTALEAAGILTPHTVVAVGEAQILSAAEAFVGPFIIKHNRGGKGLGVHKFENHRALASFLASDAYVSPVDGITLVQDFVRSPSGFITRCEFVGGKFMYAVRVDASDGFELCPADVCEVGADFCPTANPPGEAQLETVAKFQIIENFDSPLLRDYELFLRVNGIDVAGIEFITDERGRCFTYDVNTNTNYNGPAEAKTGHSGMGAIARHLLQRLMAQPERAVAA